MNNNYSLVVPTYNAGECWCDCLQSIQNQTFPPKEIIIIDSSSIDDTVKIANEFGCRVININKTEFGHGKTRQKSLSYLDNVEFVVFLTQDAILADNYALRCIVSIFKDKGIGAICGRQLPRKEALVFEQFERMFNYPDFSLKKNFNDRLKFGVHTPFISNSFAAYRIKALKEVGGFPIDVILAEDMYVAAKMLMTGWSIYYSADATVYHSHDYTLKEIFGRYFDTGVFHHREQWIQANFGKASGEGKKYVVDEVKYLWKVKPMMIPYALIRNTVKFLGYKLGSYEAILPLEVKKMLSMHKGYWDQ